MASRSRKRRREMGPAPTPGAAGTRAAPPVSPSSPPAPSRTEARNAVVRAGLEPLAPGERPRAVTVAAGIALLMAAANVAAALAGGRLSGQNGDPVLFTVITTALLVVAGVGMLAARAWAVLGFQVVLGLQITIFSLALLRVEKLWLGAALAVLIGLLGWLFWKLVRALARLQMPERRPPPDVR